jgi:NAD(P)-dependent dehydrogenase (short-subunit alcohol dehydrogenase family)
MPDMWNTLITGGAGGLGIELVKVHLNEGYNVYLLDKFISDEVLALGRSAEHLHVYECDVASTASVKDILYKISKETKHINRIFNVAGIFRSVDWVPLEETDLDFIKTMVDINAVGALRVIKHAAPLLHNGSIIVNISSEAGSITDCFANSLYGYCMSKAAMNMGAKIIDNALKAEGKKVRIFCIHPGRMKTKNMGGAHSEIDPGESAESLMRLLENPDMIPKDQIFMDYKGAPYHW